MYLGPQNNFYAVGSPMSSTGQTADLLNTTFNLFAPNVEPTIGSNNVDLFYTSADRPVNVCPQTYVDDVQAPSMVQLPVPLANQSRSRAHTNRPRVTREALRNPPPVQVQIFSGLEGSTQNVPAPADGSTPGLSSNVYIYAVQDTTLYLELGGARGGLYQVYNGAVNQNTGVPIPVVPTYEGGAPGVVYGLWRMPAGSAIRAYLGSRGTLTEDPNVAPPFDGKGQGGIGTIFGGANGGGASYLVYWAPTVGKPYAALEAAQTGQGGALIAVSGGGGGSSRNASGGPAGFFVDQYASGGYTSLTYGAGVTTSNRGSAGGLNYVLGTAPSLPQVATNDLSGGGGVESYGGASNVPNPWPNRFSNYGTALRPFVSSGGASVSTDTSSGGGGGGGGLYGGGAGGYNGIAKPNNVHGAGGGGSSTFGALAPATTPLSGPNGGRGATLNLYRSAGGALSVWDPTVDNADGYLVIGLKFSAN